MWNMHPDLAVLLQLLIFGGKPSKPFDGSYMLSSLKTLRLVNWMESCGYVTIHVGQTPYHVRSDAKFAVHIAVKPGSCRITLCRNVLRV